MKRILFLGAGALIYAATMVWAANITPTPIVGPTETGENSLGSQQVTDVARLKVGSGTASFAVSGAAASGTLNFASGAVTLTATTAGASGTAPTVLTLTNSKVQAADFVLCDIDQTGATAGAVLTCSPHPTAGTITFTIYDASVTALASSTVILHYLVLTNGNPN